MTDVLPLLVVARRKDWERLRSEYHADDRPLFVVPGQPTYGMRVRAVENRAHPPLTDFEHDWFEMSVRCRIQPGGTAT